MDVCIQQSNINTPLIEPIVRFPNEKDAFNQILDSFDSISLVEMDSVQLMHRIDTKFLIRDALLSGLLEKVLKYYRILEVNGKRISAYSTIYFDTEKVEMYMMHHNQKLNRLKVRRRSYVESEISFLEIKTKNNKGRTIKQRIGITKDQFESGVLAESEHLFLNEISIQSSSLKPLLQNSFHRITLVDKDLTERVTLDINLSYKNMFDGNCKGVEGLVIIEMKQDAAYRSYFRECLNELRIKPGSISKYCLGMALLNPDLKSNGFKNKLRKINKITNNK